MNCRRCYQMRVTSAPYDDINQIETCAACDHSCLGETAAVAERTGWQTLLKSLAAFYGAMELLLRPTLPSRVAPLRPFPLGPPDTSCLQA